MAPRSLNSSRWHWRRPLQNTAPKVPPKFPDDVILEIMQSCSPYDLLRMQSTCVRFYAILQENRSCWTNARERLLIPSPPDVPTSGNWSESAYAQLIFGGGYCDQCRRWTTTPPISYMLGIYCCSDRCKRRHERDSPEASKIVTGSHFTAQHIELGFPTWLPYYLHPGLGRIYKISSIKAAHDEYLQALMVDELAVSKEVLLKPLRFVRRTVAELQDEWQKRQRSRAVLEFNERALRQWGDAGTTRRNNAKTENLSFMKRIAMLEQAKLRAIMKSPTFGRIFDAFTRDHQEIYFHVWSCVRRIVLTEIHAPLLARKKIPAEDKVACLACGKRFVAGALFEHTYSRHPEVDLKSLPKLPGSAQRCLLCPGSQKVYGPQGIINHNREKHSV